MIELPHPRCSLAQFITNFADEAVILPLVVAIACTLAALGWLRGALVWLVVVLLTLGLMLLLKLVAFACGPPEFRSPSGHTAAAAVVLGGLAAVLSKGRRRRAVVLATGFAATLIGISRLVLHAHSLPEVAAGGSVGVLGVLALARLAGSPPQGLRIGWLVTVGIVVVILFHGWHLDAEPRIHRAALRAAFDLGVCRGDRVLPDRPVAPITPLFR